MIGLDKVLVACPISQYKDYCLPQWLSHVSKLTYTNKDFYFVDNSPNRKYHKSLNRLNMRVDHIKQRKSFNETLTLAQNMIRDKVLMGGYDYLMFIECDQFIPLDIIESLMIHRQPVVGGSYPIFRGEDMKSIVSTPIIADNQLKVNLLSIESEHQSVGGGIVRAMGVGFGCTLIHKDVLKQIMFRSEKNQDFASDSFFYEDCYRQNVPVFVDTEIFSKHYSDGVGINIDDKQKKA